MKTAHPLPCESRLFSQALPSLPCLSPDALPSGGEGTGFGPSPLPFRGEGRGSKPLMLSPRFALIFPMLSPLSPRRGEGPGKGRGSDALPFLSPRHPEPPC